jgi:signal transduction histidine kinase
VHDRSRELRLATEEGPDGSATLRVQDVGVGFEAEVAGRLFDAFHTTKPDGMGIGLSISRSIIESHGGRIEAVPNADAPGATFSFSIPRAVPPTAELELRNA